MSATIDVNVLVDAASPSSRHNPAAQALMERLSRGPELLHLFWPVLMGYLRIATNPAIFERPQTPREAARNVRSLLRLPHARVGSEQEGFWELYVATAGPAGVRGNVVPDAHIAALMRLHGVRRIWTRDRDFRRFDGIEPLDPYAQGGGA